MAVTWKQLAYTDADHGGLTGLSDDDHAQYALLAGRSGGQTLIGGSGATDDLELQSQRRVDIQPLTDSTDGFRILNAAGVPVVTYDATNDRWYFGKLNPGEVSAVSGTNILDASSWTGDNGPSNLLRRFNGTIASPTAVVANDRLGALSGVGYTGSAWTIACSIQYNVESIGTYLAGRLALRTRNSSGAIADRLIISGIGNVLLGGSTDPASATKTLVINSGTAPSGNVTDSVQLYSSDIGAGNAALTVRSETGAIHKFGSYADVPGLIVNESGASTAAADLRAESDTETNMLWLDASADLLYLGGSTAGVSIAKGGDTTFLGDGSGLPYGSCYGNEIGWSHASAAQNTWYEISDADMADGELNAVTHDGSGKLTVAVAGRYLINYTCSAEVSLPSKHVQSAISISGTESNAGMSHFEAATAGAQFNVAGTAIIDLAANATIEVSLRTTDTGAPDIAVDHLNITVVMVGGT